MFVEGFTNKQMSQDANGNCTDCHHWGECVAEDGILINVIFDGEGEDEALQGKMNTHFLPSSEFLLQVTHHGITGTFNPKDFYEGFSSLFINDNNLSGTIAMGDFPSTVSEIHIDVHPTRNATGVSGDADTRLMPQSTSISFRRTFLIISRRLHRNIWNIFSILQHLSYASRFFRPSSRSFLIQTR